MWRGGFELKGTGVAEKPGNQPRPSWWEPAVMVGFVPSRGKFKSEKAWEARD